MKRFVPYIVIVLALLAFVVVRYGEFLSYVPQIINNLPESETPSEFSEQLSLTLPEKFSIEVFAKDIPGVRVMARDRFGNFWVSQPSQGTVSLVEMGEDGKVARVNPVFKNLNNPHGLAFDPQNDFTLYIAEEHRVSRVGVYSEDELHQIAKLPEGGGHSTRTIRFGPDDRLYVSIGSSCNVCREDDSQRAAIYSMNKDGGDFRLFAKGLRNTVFFDWSYVDGRMWGTDMGRDNLGDNLPPDEINILKEGANYGWPVCYGKNIHDTAFDKNTYIRNPCMEPFESPSFIDVPAHSAPLGLAFIPEEGWPEEYWYDLLVAYHGSWNRSEPTGYKIVRYKLDALGNYEGEETFIEGFLKNGEVIGRPVHIITQPGGTAFISDDKAGVIYKVFLKKIAY